MNAKNFAAVIFGALIFLSGFVLYFFIGSVRPAEGAVWGVNFSQAQAQNLELDWRSAFLALLDDLKARNIKLAAQWDLIENGDGKYNFADLDWQVSEAAKRDAKLLLVVGMKTGRWPECHIPEWAKGLSKESQQEKILKLLREIVLNYGNQSSIVAWQVENEPFFAFGECPWQDSDFLKKEIGLVKSLDPLKRKVLISDSGEFSFWLRAAELGDGIETTLHRRVWFKEIGSYIFYRFPPVYYWRRSQLVKKIFNKEVIVGELQAEPWCRNFLLECPLSEQQKTINPSLFADNVRFAQATGLKSFYFWGAEWWYWLKTKQNSPQMWDEAKKLIDGDDKN